MPDIKKVLSVITTNSSRLKDLPISYGQLIFSKDNRTISFDTDVRTTYQEIIILQTEEQRKSISPIVAFYFVEDTGVLWRYNNGWGSLTTPPSEQIVFLEKGEELPAMGRQNTLYVSDSSIHRWIDGNYVDLSSPSWGEF